LESVLGPLIAEVAENSKLSLEVDPSKMKPNDDLNKNSQFLLDYTRKFLDKIYHSEKAFGNDIKIFFKFLKEETTKIFPSSRLRVVGAFLFLRFFGPSIFSPEGFGLMAESPDANGRRNLILIAKIIQTIANGTTFQKEPTMEQFNSFVAEQHAPMNKFLDTFSEPSGSMLIERVSIEPKETLKNISFNYQTFRQFL